MPVAYSSFSNYMSPCIMHTLCCKFDFAYYTPPHLFCASCLIRNYGNPFLSRVLFLLSWQSGSAINNFTHSETQFMPSKAHLHSNSGFILSFLCSRTNGSLQRIQHLLMRLRARFYLNFSTQFYQNLSGLI